MKALGCGASAVWRGVYAVAVLYGASLAAQCPAHRTLPLAEKLLHDARVCSTETKSDAMCPVNHEPEMTTAYAMFKDCASTKPNGFLVVPTEPVTGTEDGRLRTEIYARLWTDTWTWALRFPKAEAAWTALAANSQCARGIDQLHIHVSCVSEAVKRRLEAERESIPLDRALSQDKPISQGDPIPQGRAGGDKGYRTVELPLVDGDIPGVASYRVARVTGLDAVTSIADAMTSRATDQVCERKRSEKMSKQDMAVIGSSVAGEYFVLTYESGFGHGGAEDLLDQTCRQAEAAGGRQ